MRFHKTLFAALTTALLGVSAAHATVTINFAAGTLRNANGTALVPANGLLQLVADTSSNGFAAPAPGAFVPAGGDDIVLVSFALNNVGGPGVEFVQLTYDPNTFAGLAAGVPLIFRWFPALTSTNTSGTGATSNFSGTPTAGMSYGQFRTTTNQDGSDLTVPWGEPVNGTTKGLNFLTMDAGGSNANLLGFAANIVVGVPEPSTWAMLGLGAAGLAGLGLRRRNATV